MTFVRRGDSRTLFKIFLITLFVLVSFMLEDMLSTYAAGPIVSEKAIRAHIKFLADDLLEGRAPGTRGGELAAKYIAAQFEAMGLQPAGVNGSYFQPVRLVGVKADPSTKLIVRGDGREASFNFGDEYVASTGAQTEAVSLKSELVFVGYGIDAPEYRWNDYKGDPADFRGKILVIMVNDPPATQAEPDLFGGRALTYYGRWTYKYEEAARRGAAGAILIHTDESAGYPWSVVRTSNGSWRYDLAREPSDATPYLKLRAWMTNDAAKRLFQLAGLDLDELRRQAASRDFKPVKLNLQAEIDLRSELKRVEAPNVLAVLPGRDAQLRNEYVMYTAHWDHLGVGEPDARGDAIYNGAVDNATGVAAVLAIADALSRLPESERPRRSILFLMTTAEEQGLLGAEWFARYPTVPIEKIAADINLDALNVLGVTRDFVALGANRSTLQQVVEAVARDRGLKVSSDPRPEQGSFFRSDHFPLAKVGVPAISLENGEDFVGRPAGWGQQQFNEYNTKHYHQPSDEYSDAWDLRGTVQEAEIALDIGLRVANSNEMPRYNPNDEFAKARK
ncbi:M28 family peptidase [Pyrinomonas methylaliphatogenes]|uniref:Predicted aminopeptidase n=1 Tax=Pyrinomonas methylaliphatogenes TaxID=454194 RepID=A0A0B6WYS7_9BACT|nr:M28 family peptidase [Pyrinomonas methylaliphatogenes]CDM65305.1 predicted aminopeptidase [Pyrinomonas methylaliphatogenes]